MLAVIMTCERPDGVEYANSTYDSLKRAGVWPMAYVMDGPGMLPPTEAPLKSQISLAEFINESTDNCRFGPRLGIVPTFRQSLYGCLRAHTDNKIAIFQDDIEVLPWPTPGMTTYQTEEGHLIQKRIGQTPPLSETIEHHLPAERGVFSLYLSEGRTAPAGWSTIEDDGAYPLNVGACGIVMDAETARRFVESPPFPRVDRLGSQLVQWCWREKIPFWLHSPSLLVHTGKVSCR